MPEEEAYWEAIKALETQGVYIFSKNSPLLDSHPDFFTATEIANFPEDVLADYLVALRISESTRFNLSVTIDAA